ncbi:MAG: hypothetical protein ACYDDF_09620 [Thermoplasmatota archaeon]
MPVRAFDPCAPDAVTTTALPNCVSYYATFEVNLPGTNGAGSHNPAAVDNTPNPRNDETQGLPADPEIPSQFVGLTQIQVKPAVDGSVPGDAPANVQAWPGFGANTFAVFDQQEITQLQQIEGPGAIAPVSYMGAETVGHSWTSPSNNFIAYYGYWNDVNGNGVIDQSTDGPAQCGQPQFCNAQDEFVWRGQNTGENLVGYQWVFPTSTPEGGPNTGYDGLSDFCGGIEGPFVCIFSPQDGPMEVGQVVIGAGLAGNCAKWQQYSADCVSPVPEGQWVDFSNYTNRPGQVWAMGSNGCAGELVFCGASYSEVTPEETLLISRYVVSVVGPTNLVNPTSPTIITVNADPSTKGFFRDTDWFQALAPSAVSNLYTMEMRTVRDNVSSALNITAPQLPPIQNPVTPIVNPIVDPIINPLIQNMIDPQVNNTQSAENNATDTEAYACLPSPLGCTKDIRQQIAMGNNGNIVTPGGAPKSHANPYISGSFYADSTIPSPPGTDWYYWACSQAGGDPTTCGTVQGLSGNLQNSGTEVALFGGTIGTHGHTITGFIPQTMWIGASEDAWLWYDNNGDGYIGAPDNYTIAHYNNGTFYTANTGCCGETNDGKNGNGYNPNVDTITGYLPDTLGVTVTPSNGQAWPPGSFLAYYDITAPADTPPIGPAEGSGGHLTPLTGTTPVFLRSYAQVVSSFCGSGPTQGCNSADGLIIPTGTALGLHGSMTVPISWTEGTAPNAYTYSWTGTYQWDQSISG